MKMKKMSKKSGLMILKARILHKIVHEVGAERNTLSGFGRNLLFQCQEFAPEKAKRRDILIKRLIF